MPGATDASEAARFASGEFERWGGGTTFIRPRIIHSALESMTRSTTALIEIAQPEAMLVPYKLAPGFCHALS